MSTAIQELSPMSTWDLREDAFYDGVHSLKAFNGHAVDAEYDHAMIMATECIHNPHGWSGRKWRSKIEEATSTGSFPLALADTINRELLAAYIAIPPQMRQILQVRGGNDFRTRRRNLVDGQVKSLQVVEEGAPYLQQEYTEDETTYRVRKRGRIVPISWEAWLQDDLSIFQRLPGEMAMSAANSEERFITGLFWDTGGPIEAFFNASGADFQAGFGQQGVASTALTVPNLSTAIQTMTNGNAGYRNIEDEPILNNPVWLVVGPSLRLTAEAILQSTALAFGTADDSPTLNVVARQGIRLITNAWLPIVVTTAGIQDNTWALFSGTISPGEFGTLNGHETPELFVKGPDATRVGGGVASPFDGSYDNDTISYKVRTVFGGVTLDPRGGFASDGQ